MQSEPFQPVFRGQWAPRIGSNHGDATVVTGVPISYPNERDVLNPQPLSNERLVSLQFALSPSTTNSAQQSSQQQQQQQPTYPQENSQTQQETILDGAPLPPQRVDSLPEKERKFASPCSYCKQLLQFSTSNQAEDLFSMHCPLCQGVTIVQLKHEPMKNSNNKSTSIHYYTLSRSKGAQNQSYPEPPPHENNSPQPPSHANNSSQSLPQGNLVYQPQYQYQSITIIQRGVQPIRQEQPQFRTLELDSTWKGILVPSLYYYLKGNWKSEAKTTQDGVSLRIYLFENGTLAGEVLPLTNTDTQYSKSIVSGIYSGSGKTSGKLEISIKNENQTQTQIFFEGKWKKNAWSGKYHQYSETFKAAQKNDRGTFEYVINKFVA